MLAGRGAIGPIIAMGTICTTAIAAVALFALIRLRTVDGGETRPAFILPGGQALLLLVAIGATIVASAAVVAPFGMATGIPLEIWLMLGWLVLGIALVMGQRRWHPSPASLQAG